MKLFDLHCDTLYECCETGKHLRENDLHINRQAALKYEHYVQFFALFCGAYPPESQKSGRHCLLDTPKDERLARLLATAEAEFRANEDWLTLCRSGAEIRAAAESGKAAALLSIEGAELLPEREDALDEAYDAGVRLVTLTWNYRSRYGCSSAIDQNEGLTEEGRRLVRALDEKGMLIDVSHLSDRGFWDVCEETARPFVATAARATLRTPSSRKSRSAAVLSASTCIRPFSCARATLLSTTPSTTLSALSACTARKPWRSAATLTAATSCPPVSRDWATCTASPTGCWRSATGKKPCVRSFTTTLSRLYRKCCDNRLYFFAFRYCRTIPVCYTIIRYGFSMRRSTTRSIQYHCGGYDKWIM